MKQEKLKSQTTNKKKRSQSQKPLLVKSNNPCPVQPKFLRRQKKKPKTQKPVITSHSRKTSFNKPNKCQFEKDYKSVQGPNESLDEFNILKVQDYLDKNEIKI